MPLFSKLFTDQYPQHANPYFLAIFRILFSVIAIFYAFKGIEYIDLRWQEYDYNLIIALHITWIFILFLMLVGIGGMPRNIIHFLLVLFLLDPKIGTPIGYSVQESIYLLPAFWICFVNLDRAYYLSLFNDSGKLIKFIRLSNEPSSALPIFCFCINFGTILLFAGVDKAVDPLWIDGLGFYLTASLPWIHLNLIQHAFKYEHLWLLLNYSAIVIEIIFVFLVFFRKTRLLSIICLLFFFGGLIFPLRLSVIGEIELTYILLVLSISNTRFINYFTYDNVNLYKSIKQNNYIILKNSVVTLFLFLIVFYSVYYLFNALDTRRYDYKKKYNLQITDKDISEIKYRENMFYKIPNTVIDRTHNLLSTFKLDTLQKYTVRQKYWHLFTRRHFLGIYEFKIKYRLENGKLIEPVAVFKDDMSGTTKTTGLNSIRFFQATMYPVSNIANKVSTNSEYKPNQYEINHIRTLLKYGYTKLSKSNQNSVIKAFIEVRPIKREFSINDDKPYLQSSWEMLCEYDFITNKSTWGNPERFEIQSRVPGLPNFWVSKFPF